MWHDPPPKKCSAKHQAIAVILAAVGMIFLVSIYVSDWLRLPKSIDFTDASVNNPLSAAPSNCSFDLRRNVRRGRIFLTNTCCEASPMHLTRSRYRSGANRKGGKALVTLAAGTKHFDSVKQVILRFGHEHFDFWLFLWDVPDTKWRTDPVLGVPNIKHVWKRRMTKYEFAGTFLTPNAVAGYTHIFLWDGDVELTQAFDPIRYLALMKRARLAVSQPAYSSISKTTYPFNTHSDLFPATCPRDDRVVLADFVEVR